MNNSINNENQYKILSETFLINTFVMDGVLFFGSFIGLIFGYLKLMEYNTTLQKLPISFMIFMGLLSFIFLCEYLICIENGKYIMSSIYYPNEKKTHMHKNLLTMLDVFVFISSISLFGLCIFNLI